LLLTLLFPENSRAVPHRRLILNILRSAHLLSVSILVGGVFFQAEQPRLTIWLLLAVITGMLMFLLDLYESGIALFELRGISVLLKVSLLIYISFAQNNTQIIILVAVIIFSAFISHSSKRVRHKSFLPAAIAKYINFNPNNQGWNNKK